MENMVKGISKKGEKRKGQGGKGENGRGWKGPELKKENEIKLK